MRIFLSTIRVRKNTQGDLHLKQVAKMSVWTLERAVNVESETGHIIIRIPREGTIQQLPPPAKVDLACFCWLAWARRARGWRRAITLFRSWITWAPGSARVGTWTWLVGARRPAIAWLVRESTVCFHHVKHSPEPPPELCNLVIAILLS